MTFALLGPIYLLAVARPLAATDLRQFRLPNRLVLPGIPIALFGQLLAVGFGSPWLSLGVAVSLAVLVFGLGLLANLRGLLGMGDCKLMALMTLCLGWFDPLVAGAAIGYGFALAGVGILILVTTGRITMRSRLPLGPYLLAGFAVACVQWLFTAVA